MTEFDSNRASPPHQFSVDRSPRAPVSGIQNFLNAGTTRGMSR